jgi:hypothetical protein
MAVTVDLDRIADKFSVGDGCWEWRGYVETDGYGRVWIDGAYHQAHRVMYELLVGPIPEGLEPDHLCRNRTCVNPGHLEPVTPAVNQQRGAAAKLDWDKVRFIRANYVPEHPQFGMSALGRRFCVSHAAIHKVVYNKAWVDDPAQVGR